MKSITTFASVTIAIMLSVGCSQKQKNIYLYTNINGLVQPKLAINGVYYTTTKKSELRDISSVCKDGENIIDLIANWKETNEKECEGVVLAVYASYEGPYSVTSDIIAEKSVPFDKLIQKDESITLQFKIQRSEQGGAGQRR